MNGWDGKEKVQNSGRRREAESERGKKLEDVTGGG